MHTRCGVYMVLSVINVNVDATSLLLHATDQSYVLLKKFMFMLVLYYYEFCGNPLLNWIIIYECNFKKWIETGKNKTQNRNTTFLIYSSEKMFILTVYLLTKKYPSFFFFDSEKDVWMARYNIS